MPEPRKFNTEIADKAREVMGQFFRDRRIELRMTQGDLCRCSGLTQPQLSKFEEGNQNLTINSLLALAGCMRLKIFFETADPNTVAGFEPLNEN